MNQFDQGAENFKPTDDSGQSSDALTRDLTTEDFQSTFKNDTENEENVYSEDGQSLDFSLSNPYADAGGDNLATQLNQTAAESANSLYRSAPEGKVTSVADAVESKDSADGETVEQNEAPVEKLNHSNFADHAKAMFDDLDTNENGNLSDNELKEAMVDPKYKGKDAQTVAALYEANKGGSLDKLMRGDGFGISKHDLTEMGNQAEYGMAAFRAKSTGQRAIKSHGGEDGKLSKEEIDKALESEDLSERDRINLTFLQENYDLIDDNGDGMGSKEIRSFGDEQFASKGMKEALKAESVIDSVHKEQISENSRELFANKDNPIESIQDPEAVRQTGPSCFFEASLLSVAQADPESIQQMIEANEDGTYTVTFPGDSDNPITIDPPTEAEMGNYHDSSKAGRWGNIMQKAHGKYLQENYTRRHFRDVDGGDIPAEGNFGGEARLGQTMKLLTGRDYDRDGFSITPGLAHTNLDFASSEKEVQSKLTAAFNGDSKSPVVASSSSPAHVYAITGFDASGEGGGTIEFIDPLGGGKDQISVQEALKKFNAIAYSDRKI